MQRDTIIALDAMGGDHAPQEIVKGAVQAARDLGINVALVGIPERIIAELARYGPKSELISVVPALEVIEMDEQPAQAARHKKDSSMVVGLKMVKQGQADAFVSAGNTGAVMAGAIMYLGRLKGIERPSLVALLPFAGRLTVFLDVGANADCKPSYLLQFGQMASVYLEKVWNIPNPRVALLNIGEEDSKGNQLSLEAYELLKDSELNFIGNIEGKDIAKDQADVIVTDGFTGNVVVKTMEGVADFITGQLRQAMTSRWHYKLAAAVLLPAFNQLRRSMDYREYGAGPLLGINGLVFIGHGRSDAQAIVSALRVAREAVQSGMLEAMREMAPAPTRKAGQDSE